MHTAQEPVVSWMVSGAKKSEENKLVLKQVTSAGSLEALSLSLSVNKSALFLCFPEGIRIEQVRTGGVDCFSWILG